MYTYDSHQAIEFSTLVLVIGREARGCSYDAMLGVGWSIRNRVARPRWWGHDWMSVITHPDQYSSICPPTRDNDPNLRVYPDFTIGKWSQVVQAAESAYWGIDGDPSNGSDHYYDRSLDDNPPAWIHEPGAVHVCDIDSLHFWKAA